MSQYMLWGAIRHGDLQLVSSLVCSADDANNFVSEYDWTLIEYAARCNRVHVLRYLLNIGANVNASASSGCTALHAAICTRSVECFHVLIEAGADVNAIRNRSGTPLDVCAANINVTKEIYDFACVLLRHGGIRCYTNTTPQWLFNLQIGHARCRSTAALLIGIRRYRQSNIMGENGMDVARLLARHVLETRDDTVWQ